MQYYFVSSNPENTLKNLLKNRSMSKCDRQNTKYFFKKYLDNVQKNYLKPIEYNAAFKMHS